MASGHKIDTEKFATYAMDTAKLYVEQYPWHPTMHKILIRGATVIENCLLPIGQLSEEARKRLKRLKHGTSTSNLIVYPTLENFPESHAILMS